jgi:hypothetical protein
MRQQALLLNHQRVVGVPVFPLAKFAIESHALGDLKRRDDAALDLLASLASASLYTSGLQTDCENGLGGTRTLNQRLKRALLYH